MTHPHWLAICRSENGTFFLTNHLYESAEAAAKENGRIFDRLATEYPPVMLPVARAMPPVQQPQSRSQPQQTQQKAFWR